MAQYFLLEKDLHALFGSGVTVQDVYNRLVQNGRTTFDTLDLGFSGGRTRSVQLPREYVLLAGADQASKDAFKSSIVAYGAGRDSTDLGITSPVSNEEIFVWDLEYPDAANPTFEIVAVLSSVAFADNNLTMFNYNAPNLWDWHFPRDGGSKVNLTELGLRARGRW